LDLQAHREAVYRQLHRMKHAVTAMEDYVARDDRPADRNRTPFDFEPTCYFRLETVG
jgi:hypothetical protein